MSWCVPRVWSAKAVLSVLRRKEAKESGVRVRFDTSREGGTVCAEGVEGVAVAVVVVAGVAVVAAGVVTVEVVEALAVEVVAVVVEGVAAGLGSGATFFASPCPPIAKSVGNCICGIFSPPPSTAFSPVSTFTSP